MSDTQIIELDEPEPAATRVPRRAGSLVIAFAPLVVVALVVSLIIPRLTDNPTAGPEPTSGPEPTPGGGWLITATPQTAAPVVVTPAAATSGESGDQEILGGQRWVGISPAYPARGDVAEAVLQGAAYVIGGTGTSEDGQHVYRYARDGTRERVADLPISLDHAMAATLEDRIYVFGGFVFGQASARVFSLGMNDARWIEHSLMPMGRAAGGATVLGGRVWLIGGVAGNGSWISDVWSWDGKGRWSTGFARLPTPRDHLAISTYRGSICAAGGNGGERAFECYEPVRNEWTKMPDLRKGVIAGRAVEAAGWFWVVATDVHVFAIDHWHFGPRLQTPRAGHALVTIDGWLYVLEGGMGLATARIEAFRPQQ
jgi:hypothetical protein